MKDIQLAPLVLAVRLFALRAGAAACVAVALLLAGVATWAWLLPQRAALQQELARPLPAPSTLVQAPPPPTANENLSLFYATLGEKRHAEQQVKTLFDLAAKAGLTLAHGEYKFGYDKASRVTTYQIALPVKGTYNNIWQFALQVLADVPFAALDEVSFRRDTIAEANVEARLRFTLYLKDAP
ncbi:hypothetical protein IP92_00808 [Pseudoduganella flava]|uniref:Transmembrane protein n=1 Tax=Pseudoduganella flava TaxID=871742 RepID=A0A562Q501_9BURK|nr:hypothetical protein [Pseudoduganella flava]QGZ41811.1 hypothetical protein GO485_23970 [Pseudoduganella flava]TWI51819.1 hypothetical protein IP92_00808 [Pseudoduganella flava]